MAHNTYVVFGNILGIIDTQSIICNQEARVAKKRGVAVGGWKKKRQQKK